MSIIASIGPIARRRRINHPKRWSLRMQEGKQAGWPAMNVLAEEAVSTDTYHNARNPGSGTKYTRNPNLWCASLVNQLTGIVIVKDDCGTGQGDAGAAWRTRYGDVAITKRHVIGCGHAYSHAMGTWDFTTQQQIDTNSPPTRHRFVDSNGDTVDRTQLHQSSAHRYQNHAGTAFGTSYADVHISVLDEDLPDTVHILPVFVGPIAGWDNAGAICVSQEWQSQADAEQVSHWSGWVPPPSPHYQSHHRQMIWSGNGDWSYRAWGGDSGTPVMNMVNGALALVGIISGDSVTGFPSAYPTGGFTTWADRIDTLIAVADAKAMAIGRMTTLTNYTVNRVSTPPLPD